MEFNEFVKGKKAIIVGPALYTKGQGRGKEFDSYDLVIRINEGPWLASRHPEDLGKKTDVLYHNLHERCFYRKKHGMSRRGTVRPERINQWEEQGVKWIVGPHPWLMRTKEGEIAIAVCESLLRGQRRRKELCKEFDKLRSLAGNSPSLGMISIWDILQYEIESLHLVGITFLRGGYYEEYCPMEESESLRKFYEKMAIEAPKSELHNPRRDAALIKGLVESDGRITVDDEVQEAFID